MKKTCAMATTYLRWSYGLKLIFLLCLLPHVAGAQAHRHTARPGRTRNGLWLMLSRPKEVNGLALGFAPMAIDARPAHIRGVELDLNPLGIFLTPWFLFGMPYQTIIGPGRNDSGRRQESIITTRDDFRQTTIGLHVQLSGVGETHITGMGINILQGIYIRQRGFVFSTVATEAEDFRGVQLSLWSNSAETGKGLQISLFNNCGKCQGLQIGLINRNGRKVMPILSWRGKS